MKSHRNHFSLSLVFLVLLWFGSHPTGAQTLRYGYITNHQNGTVSVFDLSLQQILAPASNVGGHPHNVAIGPDGKLAFVTNDDGYVSVIRTSSNSIVTTFGSIYDLGGIAFSPDSKLAFVAYNTYPVRIRVFDTTTLSDIRDFPIAGSEINSELAVSPDGFTLYVLDSGSSKIHCVNPTNGELISEISVAPNPMDAVLSYPDGRLYVANSNYDAVTVIDTETNQPVDTLITNASPNSLALSPDRKTLCVGHYNSGSLRIFNLSTSSSRDVYIGTESSDIALYRNKFLYVVPQYDYAPISVIKIDNGQLIGSFTAGIDPQKIAISPLSFVEGTSLLPAVTDLAVKNVMSDRATLTWVTSGSETIYARFYDLRYDTRMIIDATWPEAREVPNLPIPSQPGKVDSVIARGLPTNTQLFFALRVIDNRLNSTKLSNVVSATTLIPPQITVAPTSFEISLFEEDSLESSLTISNIQGGSPLEYEIEGAVSPGLAEYNYAYVANNDEGTVSIIDLSTKKVVCSVYVGGSPDLLALTPTERRLFVGISTGVAVVDLKSRILTATLDTEGYPPTGMAVSRDGRKFFVSYGSQPFKIKIFDAVTLTELANFSVLNSARNSDLIPSPDGKIVYLLDSQKNRVYFVDASGGQLLTYVSVNYEPRAIVLSPGGDLAYVANYNSRTVSVIDTRARQMLRTLPTNASPNCLALSRDGKKLFVGHYYDKSVRIFDLELDTFSNLPIGDTVADMVLSRDDRYLYVVPSTDDAPVMIYELNTGQLLGQISVGRDPAKITLVRERMPGIIRTEVSEGEIPVGSSQDIKVLFTAAGVDSGDYPEQIQIINNDPTNPVVSIPAYIAVRPDTTPPAAVTDLIVSSGAYIYQAKGFDETQKKYFYTSAAVTQFEFQIKTRDLPIDSGRVTVDIFGDFDNVNEYATVFIEEQSLGIVRGSVSGHGTGVWNLLAERLQAWLEDGVIKIKVENSPDVDVIYAGTDRHEVRLQIFSQGLDSTFVWDAITLMWTAPGDDGNQGIAKAYDLRYGYTTIDETNWQQKIQVANEPAPQPAGSLEKMVVTNLIPYKRHFFALRAVDEAGNWSRLSNVTSGFPDGGKPSLKMKFFQDPALSQFLDVIVLSSEKLKSLTITADVGDSTQSVPVVLLDSVNFVYKGDYTFHASDTVRFTAKGTDLAGNVGQTERTMNVQMISSQKGGSIASLDQRLTLNFQPRSLAQPTFITLVEQSADSQTTELLPLSPVPLRSESLIYQLGPKGETLQKPSTLILKYPKEKFSASEHCSMGIYFRMTPGEDWTLLESHIDTVAGIVTTEVSQLGEYALFFAPNPDPDLVHIVPHEFQLFPNYPNPFNSETVIKYHLPISRDKASTILGSVEQKVTLKIYNLLGQEIQTLVDEFQKPGSYTVHWDGRDNNGNLVTSGVYFYKVNVGQYQQTRKMVVVR